MWNCLKKYLIPLLSGIVFATACVSSQYENLRATENPAVAHAGPRAVTRGSRTLFRTHIRIYDRNFSGILVVRPSADRSYRLAFVTEVGMTIFDITYNGKTFAENTIIDFLKRRIILDALESDIMLAFFMPIVEGETEAFEGADGKTTIYRVGSGDEQVWYYYDNAARALLRAERTESGDKKVVVTYSRFLDDAPRVIDVTHLDYEMTINFTRIEESPDEQ
jgi:predicted ester cyclase